MGPNESKITNPKTTPEEQKSDPDVLLLELRNKVRSSLLLIYHDMGWKYCKNFAFVRSTKTISFKEKIFPEENPTFYLNNSDIESLNEDEIIFVAESLFYLSADVSVFYKKKCEADSLRESKLKCALNAVDEFLNS